MTEAKKITRDTLIGDAVARYPSIAEVLMDEGIHCVGCGAAAFESIGEGLAGHGKSDTEIDELIDALNEVADDDSGSDSKEQKKDVPRTVNITKEAAQKVAEFIKDNDGNAKGLRISVLPGGCSGFQYSFELENEKKDNDLVFEIEGVNFYIDNASMDHMGGSKIDYVETLQGAGFKITNPNAESTCGCGESFS